MTGMRPWILVIDDDPWTREALGAILRRAGYRVTTAARFDPELAHGPLAKIFLAVDRAAVRREAAALPGASG